MSRAVRVDWFRVVAELQQAGYKIENIAAAVDVPKSTLMGWRNPPYSEPRHADGERLIALWCRVMKTERDALPLSVVDLLSAFRASSRR